MPHGWVICEYETVKQGFPEFKATMDGLETALIAKAESDWAPYKFGGFDPKDKQFGRTTIIPALFNDITGARLVTWDQWLNATGHQTILAGANTGNTIFEDYKVGICGLAFLDKAIRVSEIKMQISDKKLPRINIEEALAYDKPAVVFEEGYVLDEKTGFELYAYVTTQGPQRILPIGFQVNKIKDKLTTATGAPLT